MQPATALLSVLLAPALAAEWETSGGQQCIERCRAVQFGDHGFQVYRCPTVDGVSTVYAKSRSNAHGDSDTFPSDYCTPAATEGLEPGETASAETLPADISGGSSDGNGGSGGNFPGRPGARVASAAVGHKCESSCDKSRSGWYKCDLNDTMQFYCAPSSGLERLQLSSHNHLWCSGPCTQEVGTKHHTCPTLYGRDRCSPRQDRSSQSNICQSPCQLHPDQSGQLQHYRCHVDEARTQLEDCGLHQVSPGQRSALQYTAGGSVCAGPCEERDGAEVCKTVRWGPWDSQANKAELVLDLSDCSQDGPPGGRLVGIVVGSVVAAVIIIALVAYGVTRRQYSRAATAEP